MIGKGAGLYLLKVGWARYFGDFYSPIIGSAGIIYDVIQLVFWFDRLNETRFHPKRCACALCTAHATVLYLKNQNWRQAEKMFVGFSSTMNHWSNFSGILESKWRIFAPEIPDPHVPRIVVVSSEHTSSSRIGIARNNSTPVPPILNTILSSSLCRHNITHH